VKAIRFGLAAIRGLGPCIAERIEETQPHAGLYEACASTDGDFSSKTLDALVGSGSLDCLGHKRAALVELYSSIKERMKHDAKEKKKAGNTPALFDTGISAFPIEVPDVEEWCEAERLYAEKESIGFYVSGHPLEKIREKGLDLCSHRSILSVMRNEPSGTPVKLLCMVGSVKLLNGKKGTWAAVKLEDESSEVEARVWNRELQTLEKKLKPGKTLLISATVNEREGYDKTLFINDVKETEG